MEQIGEKLKQLRKSKKVTLEQLGSETGLSAGFISLVENGKSNIALDTLSKILQKLDSSLEQFFAYQRTEITDDPVMHVIELSWTSITENIAFSVLSADPHNFNLYPRIFLLHPEAEPSQVEMLQHEGEEFILVLDGVATIYYAGRSYLLYPGDSMQVHSNLPHNWANKTNRDVRMLSIHYPNPFPRDGNEQPKEIAHQARKRTTRSHRSPRAKD